MTKCIVTHIRPDLDACASVWLLKRYMSELALAEVAFVPAGETLRGEPADSNPDVAHVDTGMGKFDHHHLKGRLSAALRVYRFLTAEHYFTDKEEIEIVERLVELVTIVDNFEETYLPQPESDFYELGLHQLIEGYKNIEHNDMAVLEFALQGLDGLYLTLRNKVRAEKEIAHGEQFAIQKLKCIALETRNEDAVSLAQKQGFALVIRKDPKTQRARIKVRPDTPINLKKIYEKLITIDKKDQWFYHVSGKMVLNGSSKNPNYQPTSLTLSQLINLVQTVLDSAS